MNERKLLTKLEELARQAGIQLKWEDGEFKGGTYRHHNQTILMINPALTLSLKIDLLCRALARTDLSEMFLLPAVRDRIEQERERMAPS